MVIMKRKRSPAVDWSDVPDLVIDLVVCKLRCSLRDCVSLAGTCRRWRWVAKRSNALIHNINLLLPVPTTGTLGQQAYTAPATRVFQRKKHQRLILHLPEIAGFAVFGSRFGWLIAHSPSSIKLFHPFSRSTIPLPGGHPGPIASAVLTAAPDAPDSHVVVQDAAAGTLSFARPGRDAAWRRVSFPGGGDGGFVGLGGRLYCLLHRLPGHLDDHSCACVVYDLSSPDPEPEAVPPPPPGLLFHDVTAPGGTMEMRVVISGDYEAFMTYHLVEIRGHVSLVMRYISGRTDLVVQVFTLGSDRRWTVVHSLGNSCLVVHDGANMVCVDNDPDLIPGCIYYPVYNPVVEARDKKMIYRPSPTTPTWTAPTGFGHIRLHDHTHSKIYPCILLSPCQTLAYYLRKLSGGRPFLRWTHLRRKKKKVTVNAQE